MSVLGLSGVRVLNLVQGRHVGGISYILAAADLAGLTSHVFSHEDCSAFIQLSYVEAASNYQ